MTIHNNRTDKTANYCYWKVSKDNGFNKSKLNDVGARGVVLCNFVILLIKKEHKVQNASQHFKNRKPHFVVYVAIGLQ